MKLRKKSPWVILFMGLIAMVLMIWGMQFAVETVAPVAPLVDLAKAIRDLYSFEQTVAARIPPAGDPAVLRITYTVGSSSRPFPSPDAEMLDVAKYARSQFERFQGSWEGITAVELSRTGADGNSTDRKIPLAELSTGGKPAPAGPAWKTVWTATPMSPEAVDKMNQLSLTQGHQPWRLEPLEVARAQLATWLADSGRVKTPSQDLDHALADGWVSQESTTGGLQLWMWKGFPGEYRVTLQPTRQADGKPGVFLAVKIEESAASKAASSPAPPPTTHTVYLKAAGPNMIQVIKAVRARTGLGLQEAMNLVEKAPVALKGGLAPEEAEKFRKELEAAGATVEVR